jgi:hypothetical protein
MSFFLQYYDKTHKTLRKDKTPETHKKDKTPETLSKDKTPGTHKKDKTPGTHKKDKTPGTLSKDKTLGTHRKDKTLGTHKKDKTLGTIRKDKTRKNQIIATYVSDYKTELSYLVLDSYFKRFPVLFFMEQSSKLSKPLQYVIESYTSTNTRINYNLIQNDSEKLSAYIKNESTDTKLNQDTLLTLNNQLNKLNVELDELQNKCYDTCSTKYANNDETYKQDLSKMKEETAFAFANHCTSRDHNENAGKLVELHHSVPKITESEIIYLKECWEYNIIVSAIEPKIGILRARLKNLFKKSDVDVNEQLITLKENADIFYNNNVQKEKPKPSAGGKSKSRRRTRTRKIKNTRRR